MASQTSTPPSKPVQPLIKLVVKTNDVFLSYSKTTKMSIEIFYLKFSLGFSSLVFFSNTVPLIIKLFAPGQPNLDFNQAVLKINLQRHNRITLLSRLPEYLSYFILMKQKLSHPERVFIEYIALFIGTDIHLINKKFFPLGTDKGFLHAASSHSK